MNHLDAALDTINNRVHGTTKTTPFEASNDKPIPKVLCISSLKPINKYKLPKFPVRDFVRVYDKCNLYNKGYTTNWNRELFKIHNINPTNPVTYGLVDENNE